ncbi:MAG: hypothetical protein Q8L60_12005 [Gammaproteobacteria bacterium]|nr:hypothetical protein [Gammaproteobacteria bacterium]MDP2347669.1 hypothetical protein [Gammaproteobacteria bacterium]
MLAVLVVSACEESSGVSPTYSYRAEFNPADVDAVVQFVRSVAERRNIRVYEKDRRQMSFLTQGKEAFFIAFYYNDNAVLDISNVGVGEIITLGVFDHQEYSAQALYDVSEEITTGLNQQFGIQFVRK